MIQQKTLLYISDNSGAKKIRCIKVLGGFKKKTAGLGDVIIASVQQLRYTNRHNSKVLRGDVVRALIIKTNKNYRKKDGSYFSMSGNSALLINRQNKLIGTRILAVIPKKLKKKKLLKFFSLCPGVF